MHKSAMKCNETLCKWCKTKHGASKIMDTLETYHPSNPSSSSEGHQARKLWLVAIKAYELKLVSKEWRGYGQALTYHIILNR
jgi:hypothetical protein